MGRVLIAVVLALLGGGSVWSQTVEPSPAQRIYDIGRAAALGETSGTALPPGPFWLQRSGDAAARAGRSCIADTVREMAPIASNVAVINSVPSRCAAQIKAMEQVIGGSIQNQVMILTSQYYRGFQRGLPIPSAAEASSASPIIPAHYEAYRPLALRQGHLGAALTLDERWTAIGCRGELMSEQDRQLVWAAWTQDGQIIARIPDPTLRVAILDAAHREEAELESPKLCTTATRTNVTEAIGYARTFEQNLLMGAVRAVAVRQDKTQDQTVGPSDGASAAPQARLLHSKEVACSPDAASTIQSATALSAVSGAILRCVSAEGGRLDNCTTLAETSVDDDFGRAARAAGGQCRIVAPSPGKPGAVIYPILIFLAGPAPRATPVLSTADTTN